MNKKIKEENLLFNHSPKFKEEWNYELNNKENIFPNEYSYGSNKEVWWRCNKCNNNYKMSIKIRNNGCNCPYCSGKRVLFGFNDVYTLRPNLRKYFVNIEDAKNITLGYNGKILLKCPTCKNTKEMLLTNFVKRGFNCSCQDGVSYNEKFIQNLLEQLKVDFNIHKSFEWSQGKIYDFYIEDKNILIEAHGIQHYEVSQRGRTLQEEQENDKYKEKIAKENGIGHYIVIDCRYSKIEWIQNSILNSELNELFDLKNVDCAKCNDFAMNSLSEKVKQLYLNGKTTREIVKITKLNKTTIASYLKNFGVFIPNRDIGIKVYCYNINKIFNNKKQCCNEMQLNYEDFCKKSKDKKEEYFYKGYKFINK